MQVELFEIAERFCGPPRSGNGGYVCGRTAKHLQGTLAVRLKAPPPLNVELRLESSGEAARLYHGSSLIAEAKPAQLDLQPPPCPSYAEAEQAMPGFIGFSQHAFPGCFVCGPAREAADGLRIFPGALDGGATIAGPWVPDASLAAADGSIPSEFIWAALDCTGAFAVLPAPAGQTIVLGELCTSILTPLQAGERCIVMGWPLGSEGRKRFAGSALYSASGRLVAMARAVWIEVPLSTWG